MKITNVSYRRLQTFGQYNNETVEASAILDETDDAEVVLANLRMWVDGQLGSLQRQRNELVRRQDTVDELIHRQREWEQKAQEAREQYERIVTWFTDRNIPLPDRWGDTTLPF